MATKVTVLGQEEPKEVKKPIEFVKFLERSTNGLSFSTAVPSQAPSKWDEIHLLYRDYGDGLDLMFARVVDEPVAILVLGHFNDGVVE